MSRAAAEEAAPGRAARPKTGRRPGDSGTRDAIVEAARRQFAEQGYDRTSIRSVALEAAVDPGLVTHFFGSKQRLFAAVIDLPLDPAAVVGRLTGAPAELQGRVLAAVVVGMLEDDTAREGMVGLIRAAAAEPQAARMVCELVTTRFFSVVTEGIGAPDPDLRASLIGSQVVGLVMARHVVQVEPLASASREKLMSVFAPVFQHYLTEPLEAQPG